VKALLDTSFFVASESGRPIREISDLEETVVSVITLAELTLGVLLADDTERTARLGTLSAVESTWDPLPIDVEVARAFARLVAGLRSRRRRVPILDVLIAATAVVEQVPVVTQDRDYGAIPEVSVIRV
jgi:predicted nucleic acid-binding protein